MPTASAPVMRRTTGSGACAATRRALACDSRSQSVTGAANCLDQTRPAAQLELVAQVLDAHVDQVRIAEVIEAPDILQDLLAREHLAWMPQEELEQLVFARGQLQQIAVATGFALARHHLDILKAQDFDLARLGPTQQGAHARHELIWVKRFDDVIIGATVEASDFVDG